MAPDGRGLRLPECRPAVHIPQYMSFGKFKPTGEHNLKLHTGRAYSPVPRAPHSRNVVVQVMGVLRRERDLMTKSGRGLIAKSQSNKLIPIQRIAGRSPRCPPGSMGGHENINQEQSPELSLPVRQPVANRLPTGCQSVEAVP